MNKDTYKRLISLFFLLSIITLMAFFFLSYYQYYRLNCAQKLLIESYRTIHAANQTLIALDEAALNINIFLQTKEIDVLNKIPQSIATAKLNFETLQQLGRDNPIQNNLLLNLTPLLQNKIAFWKKIIAENSTLNKEQIFQLASDKNRLELIEKMKEYLVAIKQTELKQLETNEQHYMVDKIGVKKIICFIGLLCGFFFVCSFTLLNQYLKEY